MAEVHLVLVGAEAVVENGGIVNVIGTYQAALVASALNVPFYVAAESFKFARMYPLGQRDITERVDARELVPCEPGAVVPPGVMVDNPGIDFTPAKYVTLLFCDMGVLTPAAVSDALTTLFE